MTDESFQNLGPVGAADFSVPLLPGTEFRIDGIDIAELQRRAANAMSPEVTGELLITIRMAERFYGIRTQGDLGWRAAYVIRHALAASLGKAAGVMPVSVTDPPLPTYPLFDQLAAMDLEHHGRVVNQFVQPLALMDPKKLWEAERASLREVISKRDEAIGFLQRRVDELEDTVSDLESALTNAQEQTP